tara:strand:+ start:152 stop:349 length:198 start_codon:yes stop_codon:yes gene_type:complete
MKSRDVNFNEGFFIPIKQTCILTNLSPSSLYRMEKVGEFPKRVSLSPMRKGHRKSDVLDWIEGRS